MILDDLAKIEKLDKSNMLGSIELLDQQISAALDDFRKITIPQWKNIDHIVACGMGGSSIGMHILKSLYLRHLQVPLEIVNNYYLPGWVNQRTLCIIFTYSGNTEEPLKCLEEATKKEAMIFGMASGGKLADLIHTKAIPGYIFDPFLNPCGQPRMGLGYSIFNQLFLLSRLGIIELRESEIKRTILKFKKIINNFGLKNDKNNPAKKITKALHGFIPVILASDFLIGSAHTFANQINENAKTFAMYFPIPEANHHLMEGLSFPEKKTALKFLLLKSKFYYPENFIRHSISEKILRRNRIKYITYECLGETKLEQVMEILALGSYSAFYLSMLNKIDPTPIPNVDYFKMEMAKI